MGSSKKGSHVYFLLQVSNTIVMSNCTIVWYKCCPDVTIVESNITIVVPGLLSTGSKHDYLFCYCPLVGILFEILRIDNPTKDRNLLFIVSLLFSFKPTWLPPQEEFRRMDWPNSHMPFFAWQDWVLQYQTQDSSYLYFKMKNLQFINSTSVHLINVF